MSKSLLKTIEENRDNFSKGQKLIADYIVNLYDKAAFMTAAKLGKTVGVSESTVVRFAMQLGYEGYPELQRALQEMIRNRLTSVQRMEVAEEQLGNADVLTRVLNMDIERIKHTLEETSKVDFNNAVESLMSAKTVYIIGIRSAYSLASFLGFYFNLIFDRVKLINGDGLNEIFEQILRIGKDDVIIGISFPRYSKRTYRALQYAADKGAKVIAITDSMASPIVKYATNVLLSRSDMASFVDSLVAPMSLLNALIIAAGLKKKDEVYDTFNKLEKIWEEYEMYEKSGENEG